MQREMQEICMKMVLKFSTIVDYKKTTKVWDDSQHSYRQRCKRERGRTFKKMTPFFFETSTSTKWGGGKIYWKDLLDADFKHPHSDPINQRHCDASFSALTLLYNFYIYHLHHHHLHHYYHRCHHHLYWCCYHHRPHTTLQYWNKQFFTQNKTRWSPLTPFDRARCLTRRVYWPELAN